MKIDQFEVSNLRGVQHFSCAPATLTFFTGPSGAGKSSTMDAIRFALVGKLPRDGMKMGSNTVAVNVHLDGLGSIQRTQEAGKTTKVRVNGKTTTAKSAAEMMEEVYGCSTNTIALMTSSELTQKKDLIQYLFDGGFLKNDVTFKRLVALCDGLSSEAVDELAKLVPQDPAIITLEDIANAHSQALSMRLANKKLLAEATARAEYTGVIPSKGSVTIHKELDMVKTQLAAIRAQSATYKQMKAAADKRAQTLRELQSELDKYAGVTAIGSRERAAVEENMDNVRNRSNLIENAILNAQRTIESMDRILGALASPVCPISGKLVCTTDKTVVRDELEATKHEAEETKADLLTQREGCAKAMESARAKASDLMEREKRYQQKIALTRQYENVMETSIILPAVPDESTIVDLEAQEASLQEMLDTAVKYEATQAEAVRAKAFQEQVNISEELVANLAPNGGIRKQVLMHSIGVLEDACNAKMATVLPKYKMFFDVDSDFEIALTGADGTIHYDALSSGEKARMTFILLSVLSELNGFRIIMLDDVSSMDLDTFKTLLSLIEKYKDDFDHVFIAGLNHAGFEDAVKTSGIDNAVYHFC